MKAVSQGAAMVEALMAASVLTLAAGCLVQLSLLDFEAVRVQELAREGARHLHRSQVDAGRVDLQAYVAGLGGRGALELDRRGLQISQTRAKADLGLSSPGGDPVLLWLLRGALESLGAWRVEVNYEPRRRGLLKFLGRRKLAAEAVVITGAMRMSLW